jgi:hypothetical protein
MLLTIWDRRHRRTDEDEPGLFDSFGKIGVFRQEPVAGVNGVGARRQRCVDDQIAPQITFVRRRRAEPHRIVGHDDMLGLAIGIGEDGDGADAEVTARPDNPAGYLTPIGDQDFLEHRSAVTSGTRRNVSQGSGH